MRDRLFNTMIFSDVSYRSMLSKKVFLAGEKIFSAPPVHFARADVRDHVESQEIDHRASYVSY